MKRFAALAGTIVIALWAVSAAAGVVITEEQSGYMGSEPDLGLPKSIVVMIQGNKEKRIEGNFVWLTDLEKAKTYGIDPVTRTYGEGELAVSLYLAAAPILRNVGAGSTVAGFECGEFAATEKVRLHDANQKLHDLGDFSVNECISQDVPGAAEYSAFQRQLLIEANPILKKMNLLQSPTPETMPEGVPLETVGDMKPVNPPPEMSPDAEEKSKTVATPPPSRHKVLVTKIETKELPEGLFEIPEGYSGPIQGTKQGEDDD